MLSFDVAFSPLLAPGKDIDGTDFKGHHRE